VGFVLEPLLELHSSEFLGSYIKGAPSLSEVIL